MTHPRPPLLAMALLALTLLAVAAPAAGALPFAGVHIVACTSTWAPFVFQDSVTNAISGYEIDLFLAVQARMGFTYTLTAMDWETMLGGLLLNSTDPARCDVAPASLPVNQADTMSGIVFSVPTYRSGYSVAIPVVLIKKSLFAFAFVFTWELWVALVGTGILLGYFIFLTERDYVRRGMGKSKMPSGTQAAIYEGVFLMWSRLFNLNNNINVVSVSSKIISLGWGLTVLVSISSYTAGLTASLTTVNFRSQISSVNDLTHARVEMWDASVNDFKRYGYIATGMPWDTDASGVDMLNELAAGHFDALVIDAPWLKYMLADRCDLQIVGSVFKYINNAVGLGINLGPAFTSAYNAALNALMEDGTYEKLQSKYVKTSSCPSLATSTMVTFQSVEGLWVVLAACTGFALLLAALPYLSHRLEMDVHGSGRGSFFSRRANSAKRLLMARNSSANSLATDSMSGVGRPSDYTTSHHQIIDAAAFARQQQQPVPRTLSTNSTQSASAVHLQYNGSTSAANLQYNSTNNSIAQLDLSSMPEGITYDGAGGVAAASRPRITVRRSATGPSLLSPRSAMASPGGTGGGGGGGGPDLSPLFSPHSGVTSPGGGGGGGGGTDSPSRSPSRLSLCPISSGTDQISSPASGRPTTPVRPLPGRHYSGSTPATLRQYTGGTEGGQQAAGGTEVLRDDGSFSELAGARQQARGTWSGGRTGVA